LHHVYTGADMRTKRFHQVRQQTAAVSFPQRNRFTKGTRAL